MATASPLVSDASELYYAYEREIHDWEELQSAINHFGSLFPGQRFVWRGQGNATWGLWSSLYRHVAMQLGELPTEDHLVQAETRLLELARVEWRLDGIPALQLFARMQHVGVPTRLIDATWNPLIAAWFAVASDRHLDAAGRLFAFPVPPRIPGQRQTAGQLQLNSKWNGNTPRWHRRSGDPTLRDWGTGVGRWVWQPPALHTRIPAQSAAFLLDGVPIDAGDNLLTRVDPDSSSTYTADQTRTFASIPIRFWRIRSEREPTPRPITKGIVFTYLITKEAKRSIRHQLEQRFGYSYATIYADIEGLAQYLHDSPERLVRGEIDPRRPY